ncbi:MAG: PQQ-binding-like beta-propeller repeat protein [Rhodopirellula sp.]|nr:PQQ-binding-like beta-propeller repeat protein [Rhodopirellula sp.]
MRFSALRSSLLTILSIVVTTSGLSAADPDPLDWPFWRGPEMNGISRETGIVDTWSPDGENLLWFKPEFASRSTPIVMNGKIYFLANLNPGSEEEGEKVVCADAVTGEVKWENKFNVFLSDVPDTRVAWSSVVGDPETGHVFALGVCGYFQCIDGETGKTLWNHSLSEEFGLLSTYGGRTNFPIVYKDQVIISSIIIGWGEKAKPQHSFISFDKRNGQPVWFNGTAPLPDDTTYSSPVLSVVNGMPVMVFGSGDGAVHAFQPSTGVPVWRYDSSQRGMNITPVVIGDTVISGHSEENIDSTKMGALFALDLTKTGDITKSGERWRNREMFVGKSSPVVVGDRIYAVEDSGNLLIVDLKTGEQLGREKLGTMGRASLLYADGKLFTCEGNGRWAIFKITDDGLERIHRLRLDGDVSASPIISHGRLYVTTGAGMYCIGNKDAKPAADARPESSAEAAVGFDMEPAQVQVVPVDSLLKSGPQGQRQLHHVRLYNSKGQYLKTCKADEVEFSVSGPGTIDADGRFTASKENAHGATILTAKVGKLTGTSRIRSVPDFPWEFTFSDGEIPVTWIGARYRHIALDFDLYKKLEAENVLLSRLYVYFRSEFVNFAPTRVFDNTTPQQRWTGLLDFSNLLESVKTLDDAKAVIDPLLTTLKKEGVLAEWSWENVEGTGPRLTVKRGADKVSGNGVMCKITTIPKGARSQGWMGRTNFSNYSIQADVYSAERNEKLGDAGVIGQRYRLDLMGAAQELKLISWISHEEKFKTVPFEWKPNTWYTLKLSASVTEKDGKKAAVLKGKCWPRDGKEPEEWTITWEDHPANEIGSPGLFGNAKDAEVFFDNVKVSSN